jgi:zinc protease
MRMTVLPCLFVMVLCAGTSISTSAQAAILNVQQVTSASGIKAWLVEDHTVPVISLRFLFKGAGAANDPMDKQGLSQILSNTLDEGAGDLLSKDFQAKLNDHSIALGFQSSRDDFGGSIKTLSKYQKEAFDLLSLALTKPRFDKDPVGRMIESNLVRIRNSMTDPEWMNARLTNGVIYAGHPYAMNTGGTLSSLQHITPDDLRGKFKSQMAQDNLIVAVAGDMTAADLSVVLDKVFAQMPKTSKVQKIDDVKMSEAASVTLYEQKIPQTVVNMVLPGIKHTDPDYHAAEVMDFVLGSSGFGSRLTEEIREKRGLTYGIYSSLDEMEHANVLSVGTATRNDKAQEVIDLTKKTMAEMTQGSITAKELADAKSYLVGSVPLQLTSTDRISGALMSLLRDNLPPDYLEQRAADIQKLTADDVLKVSRRLLKPENIKIILVGEPKIGDNHNSVSSLPNVE